MVLMVCRLKPTALASCSWVTSFRARHTLRLLFSFIIPPEDKVKSIRYIVKYFLHIVKYACLWGLLLGVAELSAKSIMLFASSIPMQCRILAFRCSAVSWYCNAAPYRSILMLQNAQPHIRHPGIRSKPKQSGGLWRISGIQYKCGALEKLHHVS